MHHYPNGWLQLVLYTEVAAPIVLFMSSTSRKYRVIALIDDRATKAAMLLLYSSNFFRGFLLVACWTLAKVIALAYIYHVGYPVWLFYVVPIGAIDLIAFVGFLFASIYTVDASRDLLAGQQEQPATRQ